MAARTLTERITLGLLASTIYVASGVLGGVVVGGCTNPVEDTYGKGVNGGQKAIEKARGTQDKVNESARQIQEQEKKAEAPE